MKKLFLLLALMGMVVVGCSKDEVDKGNGNKTEQPNENDGGDENEPQEPTEKPGNNTEDKEGVDNYTFITDAEDTYIVNAEGGDIVVTITTDMEYEVVIPEDALSWLSIADTRGELRMEKLTFTVAENKTNDERSSVVTLYDNDDNILQKINITQSAKSNTIANNEIWYTTTDGNRLFPNNIEPALFGAFLVSNTYRDGKGVLTFDDDITLIGGGVFSDCTTLATITIPESVTKIGDDAFRGCSSLTSITIPDGVTTIGDSTFSGCSSLTSVTIGDSVTTIGNSAFSDCDSLTSVTIPDSVTTIGKYAFLYCSRLKSVYISDLSAWCKIDFINGDTSGTTNFTANPLCAGGSLYLNGEIVKDLVIPSDITEIKSYAFCNYNSLTSVTIPDSVTTIGKYAFSYCDSLTSVTIPDSVTTIGKYAFLYCSRLKSVYISDLSVWCKIDFINGDTSGTTNFTANPLCAGGSLYLNGEIVKDLVIPSDITEIKSYAFCNYNSLTSVTIPDSVTTIGKYAFSYCDSLTSVTIGDSVTSIGEWAFGYCGSLTSVTIGDSVTTIGYRAFYGCTGELVVNCNIPSASDYSYGAFYGSKFTTVTIGNSVTTIGDRAFYSCSSLTSVTIGNSVTTIGYRAFYGCSSLTSVTIGDSVTEIGDWAFYGCTGELVVNCNIPSASSSSYGAFYGSEFTSVTIGDSVTEIGADAFLYCTSLTSVTIGNSVTTIGGWAFYGCSSLTSVTIGDSVTTIGRYAFYDCTSLTSVYCKAVTPPAGGSSMFSSNASGRKIYVPTESVEAYKSASYWSSYADDIVGYNF